MGDRSIGLSRLSAQSAMNLWVKVHRGAFRVLHATRIAFCIVGVKALVWLTSGISRGADEVPAPSAACYVRPHPTKIKDAMRPGTRPIVCGPNPARLAGPSHRLGVFPKQLDKPRDSPGLVLAGRQNCVLASAVAYGEL